jgi:hypothetical protein
MFITLASMRIDVLHTNYYLINQLPPLQMQRGQSVYRGFWAISLDLANIALFIHLFIELLLFDEA